MAQNIAIIGGGNLGTAIALGLVKSKLAKASAITVTRRNLSKIESMKADGFQLTTDNVAAVLNSELIILAVQPKQLAGLLGEIAHYMK